MDKAAPAADSFGIKLRQHRLRVGVLLLVCLLLPALLYFAESRVQGQALVLRAARSGIVEITAGVVDPAREGLLVHLAGNLASEEPLRDDAFGVSVNALRLYRTVEMYQWVAATEQVDHGGATGKVSHQTYVKRWSHLPAHLPLFPDQPALKNPSLLPYEDRVVSAPRSKLAGYVVPAEALMQLARFEPLLLTDDQIAKTPEDIRAKSHIQNGQLFLAAKPESPEVGDVRVAFQIVKAEEVSALGLQHGSELLAAPEQGLKRVLVGEGSIATEGLLTLVEPAAGLFEWSLRAASLTILMVCFALVFRKFLPNIALAPFGPRSIAVGLAALAATALFGYPIAVVWLPFRAAAGLPFAAAALLATIALIAFFARHVRLQQRLARAAEKS